MGSVQRSNEMTSHVSPFRSPKAERMDDEIDEIAPSRVYALDSDPLVKEEIRDAVQSASEAMSSGLLDWDDSDSSQRQTSTSIHTTGITSSQNGGTEISEIMSDDMTGPSAPFLPVPNTWQPIHSSTQRHPPSRQGSLSIDSASASSSRLSSTQGYPPSRRIGSSSRLSSSSISSAQFSDENSNIFETQARLFERAVKAHDKLRKQNSMQRRQIDALRKRIRVLERSARAQQQQTREGQSGSSRTDM